MNYEKHVLGGILSYPLFISATALLKYHFGLPLKLSTSAVVIGYALYVFGSDLPDIDHPDALIHRGAKAVVAVLAGAAVSLRAMNSLNYEDPLKTLTVGWMIGTAGALAAWYGFSWLMPRHRGVIHSLAFATVYGLTALLFTEYGINMGAEEALFVGVAAFSGYTLHLLLDGSLKLM